MESSSPGDFALDVSVDASSLKSRMAKFQLNFNSVFPPSIKVESSQEIVKFLMKNFFVFRFFFSFLPSLGFVQFELASEK